MRADAHHSMYAERVHANTYKEAQYIRELLIARKLPRDIHEELHAHTSPVPLLGYHTLRRVARDLDPYYPQIQDGIDDWCFAVERSNEHPKAKPMEIKLGELAIETVREQLPFLDEGLPRKPKLYLIQGALA